MSNSDSNANNFSSDSAAIAELNTSNNPTPVYTHAMGHQTGKQFWSTHLNGYVGNFDIILEEQAEKLHLRNFVDACKPSKPLPIVLSTGGSQIRVGFATILPIPEIQLNKHQNSTHNPNKKIEKVQSAYERILRTLKGILPGTDYYSTRCLVLPRLYTDIVTWRESTIALRQALEAIQGVGLAITIALVIPRDEDEEAWKEKIEIDREIFGISQQ